MNRLNNQRGSITLYVLLSMLFFLIVTGAAFVSMKNKETIQDKEISRIQQSYEQREVDLSKKNNIDILEIPDEYQQVDYIESTRTQMIDTGYIPRINTKLELELSFSGSFLIPEDSGGSNSLFSSKPIDDNTFGINFGAASNQGNTLFPWFNKTHASGASIESFEITDDIKNNKNTIIVENGKITYGTVSRSITPKTANQINPLILFGDSKGPFASYNMRVFRLTIFEGDEIKGYFIPSFRISDGEIGLYDTINRTFHSNTGTGTFNKGENVN